MNLYIQSMKYKLLLVLILLSFLGHSQQKINIGVTESIHSGILGEDRLLDIHLPEGYEKDQKTYPVLYLLDSFYNFDHAVGTVNYLILNELIPEMIIVGVRNTRRNRDLTPQSDKLKQRNIDRLPNRGGADQFINFLSKELIPFVENNYRAAPYKILVGHSLGGLFNAYSFYKEPELFNAYLTISPSLWYQNDLLEKDLDEILTDKKDFNSKFYLTIANEGGTMLGNTYKLVGKFKSYIAEHKEVELKFEFDPMFELTHGSIGLPAIFNGLKFIFEDLQYEVPSNKENIIAQGGPQMVIKTISDYYAELSKTYGFKISDERTMSRLGYTLLKEEDFQEAALQVFKTNTENYPESFSAFRNLGGAYKKIGDIEKARENYEKALKLIKETDDPEWEFFQTDLENLNLEG